MSEQQCTFCAIAGGAAGAFVVYENPHAVVFLDKHPINVGHLLAIPRCHVASFHELDEGPFVGLMLAVRHVASVIEAVYRPEKVGMLAAGFDVAHAHIHVLPMYDYHDLTSKVILEGRRANPSEEELRVTAERLRERVRIQADGAG